MGFFENKTPWTIQIYHAHVIGKMCKKEKLAWKKDYSNWIYYCSKENGL